MIYSYSSEFALIESDFDKRLIYRSRIGQFKRFLSSGASISALVISRIVASALPAVAAPAITYSGDVAPPPPTGTVNWTLNKDLHISQQGFGSIGEFSITGGATFTTSYSGRYGSVFMGTGPYSVAKFTVDGKGSAATLNSSLIIGSGGGSNSTFTIKNGGSVNVSIYNVEIGTGSDLRAGTARMIVVGSGSSLNIGLGNLLINGAGVADMSVTDGATVTTQGFELGSRGGANGGTTTVSGDNSALNILWTAGVVGNGTLNLLDGGILNTSELSIFTIMQRFA